MTNIYCVANVITVELTVVSSEKGEMAFAYSQEERLHGGGNI